MMSTGHGMVRFTYSGRDSDGSIRRGQLAASSRDHALRSLRTEGIAVTHLDKMQQAAPAPLPSKIKVPPNGLAILYKQLAALLDAGVPLLPSLALIGRQSDSPEFADMLNRMAGMLERGGAMWESMAQFPSVFTSAHVAMVRAGEVGGFLPRALSNLCAIAERADSMRSRVRSATTYPLFVLVVSLVSVMGLFEFVLPQFIAIVEHMHAQLPWMTRLLLVVVSFFRNPLVLVGSAVAVLVAVRVGRVLAARRENRRKIDALTLRAPLLGPVMKQVALARAMHVLAGLCNAGVSITEGLELAGGASGNVVVGAAFMDLSKQITQGLTLAEAMRLAPTIFSTTLIAYVDTGEATGRLADMLVKAADVLTLEAESVLDTLPNVLEPVIIVALGCVIGFIVLAFFVPLYGSLKVG